MESRAFCSSVITGPNSSAVSALCHTSRDKCPAVGPLTSGEGPASGPVAKAEGPLCAGRAPRAHDDFFFLSFFLSFNFFFFFPFFLLFFLCLRCFRFFRSSSLEEEELEEEDEEDEEEDEELLFRFFRRSFLSLDLACLRVLLLSRDEEEEEEDDDDEDLVRFFFFCSFSFLPTLSCDLPDTSITSQTIRPTE